jgi:cell division protein FtsW
VIEPAPAIMIEENFTEPDELKRSSFTLLACVLILLAFGTVMVWSASAVEAAEGGKGGLSFWTPLFSHLKKVAVGLALMFAAARLDLRRILKLSSTFYLVALLLLALVLVPKIGLEANGSKRWLATNTLIGFALQPSEVVKLALIVFLSAYIAKTPDLGASFRKSFLPAAAAILVPGALILCETDFGTFVLVATLGFLLLLLAGARVRHLVLLAILGGGPALGFLMVSPKAQYIRDRVSSFLDHHVRKLPTNAAQLEQIDFAESALKVGGVSGVGLGAGRHKLFFLKESENDFILSVVGEELGFVGTTAVVFLFALLLWSGRRVLLGVRHRFGFFVTAGVLITIAMQALMNVFVAVRWAPVKGIPLPFVSSGGSSLAVLCLGIGMILSVARHGDLAEEELHGEELPEAEPVVAASRGGSIA